VGIEEFNQRFFDGQRPLLDFMFFAPDHQQTRQQHKNQG
jgi:hypothetical protein